MGTRRRAVIPLVSVLVPVRNEVDELAGCLDSLARQSLPLSRVEVLVADGSDRPIPDAVVSAYPGRVTVLPNPARRMTTGLNQIAARARGTYLAIVSAHSTLPPDYLESAVRVIEETGAANVGGRIWKVAHTSWGRAIAAATSSPLAVGNAVQHHGAKPQPADSAFPGFIERQAFEKIGGFDVRLACNEDDEFNARLRSSGRVVWYEPSLVVSYHPRERLGDLFAQYFRYGRWKPAVARLGSPGYLRWRHVVPTVAVLTAAAAPGLIQLLPASRIPLLALGSTYLGLAVAEGWRMGRRHGASPWRTAATFPVVHVAYGAGFLRGLVDRGLPDEPGFTTSTGTRP
jgi:succinoglycan biosynthesis protein ExoA